MCTGEFLDIWRMRALKACLIDIQKLNTYSISQSVSLILLRVSPLVCWLEYMSDLCGYEEKEREEMWERLPVGGDLLSLLYNAVSNRHTHTLESVCGIETVCATDN